MEATQLEVYYFVGVLRELLQLPQLLNICWEPYLFIDRMMRLLPQLGSSIPHLAERWISRIYLWHNWLLLNN